MVLDIDLQALMARYQQGDSEAAASLVQKVSPQLYRFFLVKVVSRGHADDLLQETWMRIHQVRHTYRCGQPVLPWFYAIARNIRVDHYRKAYRAQGREQPLEPANEIPETTAGGPARTPDFAALLATLPESQREVIAMLKVSGMSLEEVARATACSVGSVKQKDVLNRAAGSLPEVDPGLLDRVSASVNSSPHAVSALPPLRVWIGGLVSICAVTAILGALALGPHGVQKMSALQIGIIFPVLAVLVSIAASGAAAEVIPGSWRPVAPWVVSVAGCIALGAVFGLLFSDYHTERFVSQGVTCLTAGLLQALPAGIAAAWLLNRGFAVKPVSAAFAKGTLAGLAGVILLELHCANFEAPHVMVWHISVLPLSGGIAALAVWALRRFQRRQDAGVPG